MGRKATSKIFSISGQIETAVADTLIEQHGLFKIMPRDFPPGVSRVDDDGRPVSYAIMMDETVERQFDRMVAELRA